MKKILLIAFMATVSMSAFSQRHEKGPYLTNRFGDNWFISVGGGANIYVGEYDSKAKANKRLAPALDVSLGKWFTPSVGARIQYSGLKARGATDNSSAPYIKKGINKYDFFNEQFNVRFLHADFLWNASNALGGYRERRWNFIPFAGFGIARSSGYGSEHTELAMSAGLLNQIRLNKVLNLNLEFRGMLVNQRFDGTVGGSSGEGMSSITLGLGYKFGKHGFSRPKAVAPADFSPYTNRIKTLEGELSTANARIAQLGQNKPAPAAAAKTEFVFPQMAVFFRLGRYNLTEKERVNINYIADVIKKLPAGRKVKLVGNADSTTGSTKINQHLSEQRAKMVHDALVAAGVKPSQLEIVAHGDKKEPFPHNKPTLNRVLIIE